MVDTMFDGVNTNLNLGSAKAQTDWTPRFGPFLMRQFPVVSVCLSSSGCLEGYGVGRPTGGGAFNRLNMCELGRGLQSHRTA